MRVSDIALPADVYVMWSGIDCTERTTRMPIQGSSSVNCSIPELINNIKGTTWLKVDEMKSLYNAKTQRGEGEWGWGGTVRRDGRYFSLQAARATGYCRRVQLKKQITRLSSIAD